MSIYVIIYIQNSIVKGMSKFKRKTHVENLKADGKAENPARG